MSLFGMLEGMMAGGAPEPGAPAEGDHAGMLGAVVQMAQSQPGGIGGLVQQFEQAGLGGAASSWVSTEANQMLTGPQVQSALGDSQIGQMAAKFGITPEMAATQIAQWLPHVVDHATPNGEVPPGGGLGALGSLMTQLQGMRSQA